MIMLVSGYQVNLDTDDRVVVWSRIKALLYRGPTISSFHGSPLR